MPQVPLIFLIAGEASGDQLGANLMAALQARGKVRFAGIGGEAMGAHGLRSLFPMEELSKMGVMSILWNLPNLLRRIKFTVKTIQNMKPDAVVTIDAPEFSFRVMRQLHKHAQRPRLLHYVAPTVWAWRPGRACKISRFLDHLLCLYPFEPPYFEKYGLGATFVGHPIANMPFQEEGRDPNLLCVLPGSRASEIQKLLPIFKEATKLLKKNFPELKVIIPTLPSVYDLVQQGIKEWPCDVQVVLGNQARQETFHRAYVALAASGTVALQLASAHLPCVIAYKIDGLSGRIARFLLKTPWVCMVNILLKKTYIPELLQENCTSEKIATTVAHLFNEQEARLQQVKAMKEAIALLKAPPSRAAEVVLQVIHDHH